MQSQSMTSILSRGLRPSVTLSSFSSLSSLPFSLPGRALQYRSIHSSTLRYQKTEEQAGFLARETANMKEFIASRNGDPRLKTVHRTLSDVLDVNWSEVYRKQVDKEKEEKARLRALAEEEDKEYEGPTDLVFVGKEETIWDKRVDYLKESVLGMGKRKVRAIRRHMDTSDNPVLVRARESIEDAQDRLEDVSEAYETTQHPLVWKVRDVTDNMFGETEEGWAMGELKAVDPHFNMLVFLEETRSYSIPILIGGYLQADKALMEIACEGQALMFCNNSFKERQTLGHYWDTRILDVHSVDCQKVVVVEDTPLVSVNFMCQHVKCHRDAEGNIVLGTEYDFTSVMYMWILRRDFEAEYFNWKVVEMQTHEVLSLV